MSKRLLIFAINYAPEPTGCALSTTWWSETIAGLGWETSVVTGVPHYPSWRRGEVIPRRFHGPIRVTHRPHYVPRDQSAARRGLYELTWVVSSLPEFRRHCPDAILGVIPSLGGAALASLASVRFGVPYALLFQDLMGRAARLSGMPGAGRVAGAVSRAELALARSAAGIAVVGEGFRPHFLEGGVSNDRIFRVRNPARLSPVNEPRARVRERFGWGARQFVVLHSGSMGYKQGLETVVEAAALAASDPQLVFVFQGDGNQRDALAESVARLRLCNVQFLPLAPVDKLGSVLAAADALLLNQRDSVINMSLPSKLASYFAAGVPVIAAVSETDESAAEIAQAGAGIIVRAADPHELLSGIAALKADPALAARLGASGAEFAKAQLEEDAVVGLVNHFISSVFAKTGAKGAPSSLSRV